MTRKLIKFLLLLTTISIILIIYLSFFGVTTKRLNDKIKYEILAINKSIQLELENVKFLLNPLNLSINIKTYGPKVLVNNNKLELEFIKTNIDLKSLINNDLSIDDLQISTKAIKLNNLVLLARSFKNSAELFILDSIIKDGVLVGDINLKFDSDGKIKDDYEIKGFIKNGKLEFFKKNYVDNLNFIFNIKNKKYYLEDIEGNFNKMKLSSQSIKIKENNNHFFVNGKFKNEKKKIVI